MKKQIPGIDASIEVSPVQGEFAVVVNGEQVFSRVKERRYPELDEVIAFCKK